MNQSFTCRQKHYILGFLKKLTFSDLGGGCLPTSVFDLLCHNFFIRHLIETKIIILKALKKLYNLTKFQKTSLNQCKSSKIILKLNISNSIKKIIKGYVHFCTFTKILLSKSKIMRKKINTMINLLNYIL